MTIETILLIFILVLSIFLGFEIISRIPAILHTPLMSATNAISGITLVGAIVILGEISREAHPVLFWLAIGAVFFATINVVGGYYVSDRMLKMFKSRGEG